MSEDDIIREVQLVQGIQRIGLENEYGATRDDETLIFYADGTEQVRAQVRCVVRELSDPQSQAVDDQS